MRYLYLTVEEPTNGRLLAATEDVQLTQGVLEDVFTENAVLYRFANGDTIAIAEVEEIVDDSEVEAEPIGKGDNVGTEGSAGVPGGSNPPSAQQYRIVQWNTLAVTPEPTATQAGGSFPKGSSPE